MVIVAATLALSAGAALALQAGGVFGEASLLAERPHPASAVAVEPTECVLVPGWYLLRRLRRDGFLGERLLRDLLERRDRASAGVSG